MDGYLFMMDLRTRLKHRPQTTTDGWAAYAEAIGFSFGAQVDWATLVKTYSSSTPPMSVATARQSARASTYASALAPPTLSVISTSLCRAQNLTMRMNMRRMTRLTNAFSKKIENLAAAVALHYQV